MTPFRSLGFFLFFVATAVFALPGLLTPPASGASAFAPPIVVVYPLTYAGAIAGNEAGSDVAIVIAQRLAEGGGVSVKPYLPGTQRKDYLAVAISQRADYYVTGFLQTIGDDVSMIVQVVSTHSGSVVFSTTSTIRTFGDAGAQADPIRVAILRHAGRGLAALDAPPPAADASPSSQPTNGPGLNLTKALRKRSRATPSPSPGPTSDAGLTPISEIERTPSPSPSASSAPATFAPVAVAQAPAARGRKRVLLTPAPLPTAKPTASPAPSPEPTASPSPEPSPSPSPSQAPQSARVADRGRARATPARTASAILVIDASGGESAEMLAYASNSLVTALRTAGTKVARLPIDADDTRKNAATICDANAGTTRFYAPELLLGHDETGAIVARLSVNSIDCTGATVTSRTTSGYASARNGNTFAIDRATAKMVPLLDGA